MVKLDMADEEKMFARVNEMIKAFNLPAMFDLNALTRKISEGSKQEIEFIPCKLDSETTGVIVTGEKIHIFYEASVSPIHQIHIKLHELGHMVLGHTVDSSSENDAIIQKLFFTSIKDYKPNETIVMNRKKYDEKSEREAEIFATELINRIRLDTYSKDDPLYLVCFK